MYIIICTVYIIFTIIIMIAVRYYHHWHLHYDTPVNDLWPVFFLFLPVQLIRRMSENTYHAAPTDWVNLWLLPWKNPAIGHSSVIDKGQVLELKSKNCATAINRLQAPVMMSSLECEPRTSNTWRGNGHRQTVTSPLQGHKENGAV